MNTQPCVYIRFHQHAYTYYTNQYSHTQTCTPASLSAKLNQSYAVTLSTDRIEAMQHTDVLEVVSIIVKHHRHKPCGSNHHLPPVSRNLISVLCFYFSSLLLLFEPDRVTFIRSALSCHSGLVLANKTPCRVNIHTHS